MSASCCFPLALPTITSQIVNMLYNLVDRVYIGHMQPAEDGGKAGTDRRWSLFAHHYGDFGVRGIAGHGRRTPGLY